MNLENKEKKRPMIEFDPALEHDSEWGDPEEKSFGYFANLRKMGAIFRWIWLELMSFQGKKMLALMLLPVFAICLMGMLMPLAVKMMIDGALESLNLHNGFNDKIVRGLIWWAGLLVLSEITQIVKRSIREYAFDKNSRSLRHRTNSLFFEKSTGEHITRSRLLNESSIRKGYERVRDTQVVMLFEGLETLMNLLLSYAGLWYIGWVFGITGSGVLIVHLAWSLYLSNKVVEICFPLNKFWDFLARYQSERWRHVQRVKANAKEQEEIKAINDFYDRTILLDIKFWLWYIRQISYRALLNGHLVTVAMVAYGFKLIAITKTLSAGAIYPILNYMGKMVDGLNKMADLEHRINYGAPSIMKLKQALSQPEKLSVAANPVQLTRDNPCRVSFEGVCFRFPNRHSGEDDAPSALHQISFTIEPGEKVALLGESGAGKTTLMWLTMRFMDPTQGRIVIDGFDLREINPSTWLRIVGYIPQEAQIFSGTVRDNLLYGLPHEEARKVTDAELWEVVRALKLDLGKIWTRGLDTQLGHYGIDLSGGQKQRLMIAAAAMKKPRFMVIDEATSSLDPTTEKFVQRGLEMVLGSGVGALIVTHRLPTVRRLCDKFILIDTTVNGHGGEVLAIASSFEELAAKTDRFRQLAADQEIVL